MGAALARPAVLVVTLVAVAAEELPHCDEDDRYDTQPVFDRGQHIGWQTPKISVALGTDRAGLEPAGRYCMLSGEGPKIARARRPAGETLPALDALREREAHRDYYEEGHERFEEHGDRIREQVDIVNGVHERAWWRRDERAHTRAVAMDKWAERERDDWAKMDEEFAEYFDRDESLARGQSTLGVHAAEERMRMDMERRKRAAASAARAD